jgi:ribosomal-protein-alanine N-acetyltransferase
MLVLRAAHSSEATEIASISRQQVEHGLRWRWTPARVKKCIRDSETMVLVASQSGVLQGFSIMEFGEETAHLLLLAVQPKKRRLGIGSTMLAWLEKSCATAGIRQVRLEVRAANESARKFYEQRGYRLVGRRAAYYDRREAAVIMGRNLGQKIAG